jgi:hypothetical protein
MPNATLTPARTIAIAAAFLLCAACGHEDPAPPQSALCGSSLKHFYAEGCAMTNNGRALNEAAAASDCVAFRIEASTLGGACPVAFDTLYNCIGSIPPSPSKGRCEACAAQLQAFKTCK